MAECQAFVVQSEQMQDRGVEIVDMHAILGDGHPQIIRRSMDDPPFHAAPCHPGGEHLMVMFPTFGIGRFVIRRSPELRCPNDKSVVEQAALLEIAKERGDGAIDVFGKVFMIAHVAVRVPVVRRSRINHFDEADAALDEPPCDQALPAEAGHLAALQAIKRVRGRRFLRDVERFGGGSLHAKGSFERADLSL